ncbi:TIGR02556 family CRISPR-associated protein [Clostridium ihumii]|uniref:TIGR02556 family CRISPR-associated protein n=1 Tax=Clostridium ihumii TaxID=1470356 RepID=UPI000557017B|nr:TIGR02556 family CRISPR-associated protein [Clostridium ihumii]
MIVAIKNIGKYLLKSGEQTKKDIIKNLVGTINGNAIKEIFLINITDEGIKTEVEEFYEEIVYKALFFEAGNGKKGGGIRADVYLQEQRNKLLDSINRRVKYCGLDSYRDEIQKLIMNRIENYGKNFFAVLLINGKYPFEILSDKFLDDFYNVDFKKLKGEHKCHICDNRGEGFNTVTFKFYTNDKEVYGNINEKNKAGTVICKECLENIIIGKKYAEKYLTTYWMGSNIMFIPHEFNEEIDYVYRDTKLNDGEKLNLLDNIKTNEEDVLEEIGKGNAETDMIFFKKEAEKTFEIHHSIKSLLPSRFSFLAEELRMKKINLYWFINKLGADRYGKDGLEPTKKERFQLIDIIFSGKKFNRNIFFNRMMKQYKESYYSNEKSKFKISEINKYYNFLVDCGCIEGGFDYMREYENYLEIFENNRKYFSTNEKKAWFIIGVTYNYINWKIRKSNIGEDGKIADRTSLDKNFFFSRKFDFRDFITFCNLIDDKIRKYRISSGYLIGMIIEAKELMANKENKLSTDEAKYLFFWGMDMYFKKISEGEKVEEE